MTTSASILWDAVRRRLSPDDWTPLQELYRAVASELTFDVGDMLPEVAGASQRAWKRNVRNVLQGKVRSGEVVRHETSPQYRLSLHEADGAVPPAAEGIGIAGKSRAPDTPIAGGPFGGAYGTLGPAVRTQSVITRVIRDTNTVRALKAHYADACQRCGTRVALTNNTYYSEGHHLRPLGHPHDGPDTPANILIVCPNCHIMLDRGAVLLNRSCITMRDPHSISEEFLRYHNERARHNGAS